MSHPRTPPHHPQCTNWLCQLDNELERRFWGTAEAHRVYFVTDAFASVAALASAQLSLYRLCAASPGRSMFAIYFGPQTIFFNLGVLGVTYSASAALPLLLMLLWPRSYYRWRLQLCLLNRLLRLGTSSLQLMTPAALEHMARAMAARADKETPVKALFVYLLHPAGFWMQQANFVVPWRWALLLQLTNFGASLLWSASLPCWLQLLRQADGHNGQLAFGPAAVKACRRLQQLSVALRLLAGDPAYKLGPHVCEDEATAVQVLQIVASSLLLLLLPLLAIAALELWLKRRFLRRLHAEQDAQQADAAHEAADSLGSSSRSAGTTIIGRLSTRPAAGAGAVNSSSSRSTTTTSDANGVPGLQGVLNCFVVLVCLPLLAWSVAESVAARSGSSATSCMPAMEVP